MRYGEALGFQWGDIDFAGNFIEVKRAIVENRMTTTKSGKMRHLDMSPQLADTLRSLRIRRKEETLRKGWPEEPEWIFINEHGKPLDERNLRVRIHYKICERAGIRRIRIHDLRHTYATLRISSNHNIADVSKQLGHSSYKITIDTYYHWVPNQKKNEVAELDNLGKNVQQSATYTQSDKKKGFA
jgi:integrase